MKCENDAVLVTNSVRFCILKEDIIILGTRHVLVYVIAVWLFSFRVELTWACAITGKLHNLPLWLSLTLSKHDL